MKDLPDDTQRTGARTALLWVISLTLICGVFFLGLILIDRNDFVQRLLHPNNQKAEIFGFAPYWTLDKLDSVDWNILTTFAYFSLPVLANGAIDKSSFEWQVFQSQKLSRQFEKAQKHQVKRVVTITQMERTTIESFLADPSAWEKIANESVEVIRDQNLDGVNIDFEYIPANNYLKKQFSKFIEKFCEVLNKELDDPYITVSVLASSVRFNRIYDIGYLSQVTDGVFMMAYDFYNPNSIEIGPTAPLYGYNEGQGPFWYDVSTAVSDFLKVADARKIILGVPFYGWNYPTYEPKPKTSKVSWKKASALTYDKIQKNKLISTTPIGGWDDLAKVSWRGYFDESGWNVVYLEDKNSLALKYDLVREKNLGGVGIWALGYEGDDKTLWAGLKEKFAPDRLVASLYKQWGLF